MSKQLNFLEPTWQTGDYVNLAGKHGVIKEFHAVKNEVTIEHISDDNEKYDRNYPIADLPPYTPPRPHPDEGTDDSENGVSPDADTVPVEIDEGDTEKIIPVPGASTDADSVDTPISEITVAVGYTRELPTGAKLVVLEAESEDRWLCRVHLASGGTFATIKTTDQIQKWGDPSEVIKTEFITPPDATDEPSKPELPPEAIPSKPPCQSNTTSKSNVPHSSSEIATDFTTTNPVNS